MSKLKGNVVVGQSGGPTAVINSSLVGVYQQAVALGANKVYGMVHGIQGLLEEDLIDLGEYLSSEMHQKVLMHTPSSFLGTCRYKLPKIEGNEEVYDRIFAILDKYEISAFFYIGGNDSMDTIKMLSDYAAMTGSSKRFVGIPKTVDNDLPVTDHCPGYGSASKYIATSLKEVIRDVESTGISKPTVLLVEIMGRQAGWLAASAALAKGNDCSGADAIYLPERVFDMDAFVSFVEQTAQRKKTIVIALSEGIKTADGKYVCEHSESPEGTDAFGHKQLSGCGLVLSDVITSRLGYKTRVIEISTLQRSAAHLASETDVEEAAAAGRHGVCAAVAGESGVMVVFDRIQNHPYLCNTKTFDIHDIANGERPVPDEWITEDGLGLKEEFLEYVRPLIKGECAPVYVDGLPYHLVRK